MRKAMTEHLMKSGIQVTPSVPSRVRNIDGQPREDFRSRRTIQVVTTASLPSTRCNRKGPEGMRMKRIGPPSVRISLRFISYSLGDLERFIAAKLSNRGRRRCRNILKREGRSEDAKIWRK